MFNKRFAVVWLASITMVICAPQLTHAIQVIGPVSISELPGGGTDNTVWTGDPPAIGIAGGLDISFQDLNTSMYVGLGYGMRENAAEPGWFIGIDLNDADFADDQEKLQYSAALSDPSTGVAVYTGSSQLTWTGPETDWSFRTDLVDTQLTLSAVSGVTQTMDAALYGVESAAEVFYPVPSDSFVINALATARDPRDGNLKPMYDLWNSLGTQVGDQAAVNVTDGFWYAIPEPATGLLAGIAAVGLAAIARNRRRH